MCKVPNYFFSVELVIVMGFHKFMYLVPGTPGVGKSRLSKAVADKFHMQWIDASQEAINRECFDGYDDTLDCKILDEDKLIDELDPLLSLGGVIVDYHGCDFFPERWFDAVFVLRTDNTILFDRLSARGYSETKINNNVTSEIFQTILEEARDSYSNDIVFELINNSESDFESNLKIVEEWIKHYSESCKRRK